MSRFRISLLFFWVLVLALPALAFQHTTPAEREQNRIKLEQLRKQDQERLAYLYHQAQAFLALSPEHGEQLRKLDQDLHKLPLPYRKHLKQVMRQYVAWLNQLPAEQRRQIEQAPDKETRLKLVRQIREQQWINALPKAHRDRLTSLEGPPRQAEIARLKKQQLKWEVEWQLTLRHWDMLTTAKGKKKFQEKIDDLPAELRNYTNEYLRHLLPAARWQELDSAQGHWPWFPYLLVKLADEHPLALPTASKWPQRIADLPEEIKFRLRKGAGPNLQKLQPLEGKWPDFAGKVAELMERSSFKYEIWPIHFNDLSRDVRDFIDRELRPLLTPRDEELLRQAEGRWPAYPQTIQQLARQYYLTVPWQTLPGPGWLDGYRIKKGTIGEEW